MRYLTVEQVLFLHARLIAETGGSHGCTIWDCSNPPRPAHRPASRGWICILTFHPGRRAARFAGSHHPFVDGNQRTAINAAALFLRINGRRLMASNDEVVAFTLATALGDVTLAAMTDWLRQHSVKE